MIELQIRTWTATNLSRCCLNLQNPMQLPQNQVALANYILVYLEEGTRAGVDH